MAPRTVAALFAVFSATILCACSRNTAHAPESARPGEAVLVRLERPVRQVNQLRVVAGDRALRFRTVDNQTLQILMPPSDSDSVRIEVFSGSRREGDFVVRYAPPRAQRLLLSLKDGEVTLIGRAPSNDRTMTEARTRRARLSFDVVNAHGVVVFTGSIPNPEKEMVEVFTRQGDGVAASVVERSGAITFPVWIPSHSDTVTLYVYDAEAGLDLDSHDDRTQRRMRARLEVAP